MEDSYGFEQLCDLQVWYLSQLIAVAVIAKGGTVLHGGLVERDDAGVVLAGHSGAGKSTACRRLPVEWYCWCDDQVLVVRSPEGGYRVHPWLNAAAFLGDVTGVTVQAERSFPLAGVCILKQSASDSIKRVSPSTAVCLMQESVNQALAVPEAVERDDAIRILRLQSLENLILSSEDVPVYELELSPSGRFLDELVKDV